MTDPLSGKAAKRKLRELAGQAHSRELGKELAKLETDFSRWRGGEIDPFELSQRIHRFHDGISRDLFVFYRDSQPTTAVARAIALRLLERDEIPPDILRHLELAVELFSANLELNEDEDSVGG